MQISFRQWFEESSQIQWRSEFHPPVGYEGPGLICFDFDKTLTTAVPINGRLASTANPNKDMLSKAEQHSNIGNYCIILTGRGFNVDCKLQPYMKCPSIPVNKALKDWNVEHLFSNVIMTGGVTFNDAEDKSFKIAFLMRKYRTSWGILYDDLKRNIEHIDEMQQKGYAVRGILVAPKIDKDYPYQQLSLRGKVAYEN